MLNMINQCASVCILNKKDVPSHNQNESETLMEGKKKINNNGFDYVDLGLPSGTLWATCNVGATTPEDYGDYFAWGETSPKTEYNWGTYKYRSVNKLTKYCFATASGIVDNKTTLELSDDAAYVNWGKGWRTPTIKEIEELRNECEWYKTSLNGVDGCIVKSNKNGNSIFVPYAGYCSGADFIDGKTTLNLWSSSLSADDSAQAYMLYSPASSSNGIIDDGRFYGQSIRAVCE